MNILCLLISCFICSLLSASETSNHSFGERDDIVLIKDQWKLGLRKQTGDVIVPCEYEAITPIKGASSLFILSSGGKYGVIDENGEFLLPVKYSYIAPRVFGNKLLIQQEGEKINEAITNLWVNDNDPYTLYYTTAKDTVSASFFEMEPFASMPYVRRFALDGLWGLADIRPNVSILFPSYAMVSVCPDDDRYLLFGHKFNSGITYNIYDTQKESFILPIEKKVQYSSVYLLSGGYFLVNGFIRQYDNPVLNISKSPILYIVDLNKDYILGKSGKKVVLMRKSDGRIIDDAKNITHFKVNSISGDFLLKEGGSWVLYSDGKRYSGISGNISFMGPYAISLATNQPGILVNGTETYHAAKDKFYVSEDKKSIYYINTNGDFVVLEYPYGTEKKLFDNCSDYEMFSTNAKYAMVKTHIGGIEQAGLMDLTTEKMVVQCPSKLVKPLYGDYYYSEGNQSEILRMNDTSYRYPCAKIAYNSFSNASFCWISQTGENDSYALFSMEKDSVMTPYEFSGVELIKYPGRVMALGEDFIPFMQHNQYGIMDMNGNVIIDPEYDLTTYVLSEGFCIVCKNSKFGAVNPYTGIHLSCEFDDIGQFVQGRCLIKKGDFWGMADSKGNILIQPTYISIADFYEDLPWLRKSHFPNQITYGVFDNKTEPNKIKWLDGSGVVLSEGTLAIPVITSVIPEGLWDY